MRIAIIGYGKMGRMIEEIAIKRGHVITCRIDKDNQDDFDSEAFKSSDIAIEFTAPASAPGNLERCFEARMPVVCGSTGWTARLDEFKNKCEDTGWSLLWSSNFSIGVNIFRAVNRYLASVMDSFPQYRPSMREVHHVHKLDHPSGTAITLAEDIIASTGRVERWDDLGQGDALRIESVREGEVPGIHTIRWESDVDEIEITHSAKSRAGFALGAVMAAEWLAENPGYHTIDEMMRSIISGRCL